MNEKNVHNSFVGDDELAGLLTQKCAPDYVWRQLAEECVELAQAALKLIRVQNGEAANMDKSEAVDNLIEEMSDTILMTDIALEFVGDNAFNAMIEIDNRKRKRMRERLDKMPDRVNKVRWKIEMLPVMPENMDTGYRSPRASTQEIQAFVDYLLDRL